MSDTRLTKRVFKWTHQVALVNKTKNWVSRCMKYYKDIHMDHLTHIDFEFSAREVLKDMDLVLFELHEQSWYADINREGAISGEGGNKLRTYKTFKGAFDTESYVKQIMPFPFRSALAKFRCGVAPIRIETGRYGSNRIPVNERVCFYCTNEDEYEFHVLMKCPLYHDLREELMDNANGVISNFYSMSDIEKFKELLSHECIVKSTAKTLYNVLQRHKSLFSQ